jgi:SAM-dependent methyltransferase
MRGGSVERLPRHCRGCECECSCGTEWRADMEVDRDDMPLTGDVAELVWVPGTLCRIRSRSRTMWPTMMPTSLGYPRPCLRPKPIFRGTTRSPLPLAYLTPVLEHSTAESNSASYWDGVWRVDGLTCERDYRDKWAAIARIVVGSVLDCGCGPGHLLATLQAAGIPARGLDHSTVAVQLCRSQGLDANVGDIFSVGEKADTVVASEVIEHFPPHRGVIAALCRRARKLIVVAVPDGILAPMVEPEHHVVFHADTLHKSLAAHSQQTTVFSIEDWWLPCLIGVASVGTDGIDTATWEALCERGRGCEPSLTRTWTETESYVRFQLGVRLRPAGWRLSPIEAGQWLGVVTRQVLASDTPLTTLARLSDPLEFRRVLSEPGWMAHLDAIAYRIVSDAKAISLSASPL